MGWHPLERWGRYTGVAWVSFRAFDERGVAGLSVAVAGCAGGWGVVPPCRGRRRRRWFAASGGLEMGLRLGRWSPVRLEVMAVYVLTLARASQKHRYERHFRWLFTTLCPHFPHGCLSDTDSPSDYEPPALTVELHPRWKRRMRGEA